MAKNTNRKCSGCGGELVFSPTKHGLYCDKCKSFYSINANKQIVKLNYDSSLSKESSVNSSFNCPSCGANLKSTVREISKTCPYCNSNFVINIENLNGLKPNSIIPFAFDKEKAIEYYKQGVKKKHFLPNAFKKSPGLDRIFGTYISCFSFDADTTSVYNGRIRIEETHTSNGETRRTSYTKNISGEKDYQFKDVLIESSKHTNQRSFDQIKPFLIDNDSVYDYNEDFIRGYQVESYDNNLLNCKVLSEDYIKSQIRERILSNYTYTSVDYLNVSSKFYNDKFSYMLLPVYFIDFTYKNKPYKTYINGQTGKVGDDLPKSKTKIFFASFFIVLIIALIILLPLFLS